MKELLGQLLVSVMLNHKGKIVLTWKHVCVVGFLRRLRKPQLPTKITFLFVNIYISLSTEYIFSYTIKDIVRENPMKENSTVDFYLNKVNVLLCAFWEEK